jgi:multisubunit Na+/H+ antiporter MnhF subunit
MKGATFLNIVYELWFLLGLLGFIATVAIVGGS